MNPNLATRILSGRLRSSALILDEYYDRFRYTLSISPDEGFGFIAKHVKKTGFLKATALRYEIPKNWTTL